MKTPKILVVDDEAYICETLVDILKNAGYQAELALSGKEALEKFTNDFFDLVLLDITMPEMDGMEVLKEIKKIDSNVAIIMATGKSDVESIVTAIKQGAEDYIIKPFQDIESIKATIQKALNVKAIKDENRYLKRRLESSIIANSIIGNSMKINELSNMIKKVAPLYTTVLLIGETGTGKEIIAQTIHQSSPRADKKFIIVNCGGIPETLLESTLFGYEKGAFTGAFKRTKGVFEEADGGTLFLDEIGETSPASQVKLLRVLQDRRFHRVGGTETIKTNVRIISATNKDLQEEVKKNKFREDLYYRLNVITLFVPPLRERSEDIPLLVRHFLEKYSATLNKNVKKIEPEVLKCLMRYNWPGNVRELENIIERTIALSEGPSITLPDLPEYISQLASPPPKARPLLPFQKEKYEFEKNYLISVLEQCNWNITKAALKSGIPRQNLHLKIKKYQISKP